MKPTAFTRITAKDLMALLALPNEKAAHRKLKAIRQLVNKTAQRACGGKVKTKKQHAASVRYVQPVTYADVAKFVGCSVDELIASA